MFGFPRASAPKRPSAGICQVIERAGLPSGVSQASALRVVEERGRYSGRKVSFVRVFNPAHAAENAVNVQRYADLDTHPDLVLWSGHIEGDGLAAITRCVPAISAEPPTRAPADRAPHDDDERFAFQARDIATSERPS